MLHCAIDDQSDCFLLSFHSERFRTYFQITRSQNPACTLCFRTLSKNPFELIWVLPYLLFFALRKQ